MVVVLVNDFSTQKQNYLRTALLICCNDKVSRNLINNTDDSQVVHIRKTSAMLIIIINF